MPQQLASTDGSPPPALHCADQPLWKSTRGMKKGFVADDKFSDIIIALERRGWTRSKNASSPNFQLKWRNLSNINFRLVRADQFVNHVCNSQQLSNKALLTGHLAFRHDHAHAHARHFSEDSSAKSGADSACTGVSSKCLQGSRCCGCAGVPDGEASGRGGSGPEAFFPRCWDVRDGGVASLLKAFAVSAAAALLRRAVEADENGLTDEHRGNDKSGAASLAASISVIDRYVAALRTPLPPPPPPPPPLPPTPLARKNEPPHLRGRANDTCRGSSRCARGQDAADAVINVGDPEFSTVLTAWEAVVAKEGGNGDGKEGEEEEAGGRGDQGENEKEEEEGPTHNGTGSAQCIDSCARREMKSTRNVGASAHRTSPPCSLAGRAREALRALDTADPQSALLGAANAWVVKPAGLSCGRGVVAASSLRGLVLACHRLRWNAVVQKYVERPLLVQGFKFDIRQWVLVTSCNPLVLWGFDESYVRFSSRPFSMDASSLSDRLVHLCNHSVQKEREGFVAGAESESTPLSPSTGMPPWNGGEAHHAQKGGEDGDGNSTRESGGDAGWNDEGLPSGSRGNMWTADQLRRHLEDRFQGRDVFRDVVLPRIRSVVVQTLLGVREELEMKGRALEWLGFDLMVTEDLRVMLIEVNVSPDVSHSTPVTARLVPAATDDALRLLLDDGEADARVAAAAAASVASLDGTQPPPLPSRRRPRLPSLSELENSGATSLAPSPKPTAATTSVAAAAVAGSPAHRDCAVGRREGETGVDEGLRWRLWHKGEEESRAALRSLQDKKKAWLEARRQKRRWRCPQEEQRRTHDDPGDIHADGNCSDVDDERQALAIVDSIIKTASIKAEAEAARAAAATGAVAAGAVATAAAAAATEAGAVAAAAAAEAEAEATFSHATSLSSPSVARASWLTASPRRMGKSSIRRSATAAPVPASAVPARANVSTGSCRGNSSSSSRSCVDGATETLCTKAEGLFIGLDGPRSGVGRFFAATRGSRGQGVEEEQDEDEL